MASAAPRPDFREVAERFRLLVENVRDYAIFLLDTRGHIVTWNRGAQRLKGYTADEILGRHFSIFYPPAEAVTGKCDHELEVAASEGRFEEEGWRLRKDGSRFWANVTITALRTDDGVLVGFGKVTRDLTERKVAEREAQRFRLLVESVKDYGIFMLDPTGHVATWNIGAKRLVGFEASEIIGRHFSVFYSPADIAAGKCEEELEIAAEEGRFEEEGWRVRKDGTPFFASVTITALYEQSRVVGFAKVTRDLTERRAIEERQRALAAETAALTERKRVQEFQERFLAILGHDLRNPLAAIDMGASLLQQRSENDPTGHRVVDRILTSTRRMTRMIDQILDLTRSRLSGRLTVEPAPMDLGAMLSDVVEELRAANPTRVIELRAVPQSGAWDRDRLEQVFSNLVGNALHHGDPTTPVVVEIRGDGSTTSVSVHNGGSPIPDTLRAELFNPFRRGERDSRTKHTEGLGLGLYISRELVLAHGGDITVDSGPAGTTFTVVLPVTPPAPAPTDEPGRRQ